MKTKKIQVIGGFPQSDWNQTDDTQMDYIKNKPTNLLHTEVITIPAPKKNTNEVVFNEESTMAMKEACEKIIAAENENKQVVLIHPSLTAAGYLAMNYCRTGTKVYRFVGIDAYMVEEDYFTLVFA